MLRPVPTRAISRRLTPIVGRQESANSRGFKILNMFDRASRPTIIKSAIESPDGAVKLADSMADSSADPVKIGLWVRPLRPIPTRRLLTTPIVFLIGRLLVWYTGMHRFYLNRWPIIQRIGRRFKSNLYILVYHTNRRPIRKTIGVGPQESPSGYGPLVNCFEAMQTLLYKLLSPHQVTTPPLKKDFYELYG